jgi:hypothetical protein
VRADRVPKEFAEQAEKLVVYERGAYRAPD